MNEKIFQGVYLMKINHTCGIAAKRDVFKNIVDKCFKTENISVHLLYH